MQIITSENKILFKTFDYIELEESKLTATIHKYNALVKVIDNVILLSHLVDSIHERTATYRTAYSIFDDLKFILGSIYSTEFRFSELDQTKQYNIITSSSNLITYKEVMLPKYHYDNDALYNLLRSLHCVFDDIFNQNFSQQRYQEVLNDVVPFENSFHFNTYFEDYEYRDSIIAEYHRELKKLSERADFTYASQQTS